MAKLQLKFKGENKMANNKITSLLKERKERNISNCLSYDKKIKLDISLDNTKFFIKAVKEISKK